MAKKKLTNEEKILKSSERKRKVDKFFITILVLFVLCGIGYVSFIIYKNGGINFINNKKNEEKKKEEKEEETLKGFKEVQTKGQPLLIGNYIIDVKDNYVVAIYDNNGDLIKELDEEQYNINGLYFGKKGNIYYVEYEKDESSVNNVIVYDITNKKDSVVLELEGNHSFFTELYVDLETDYLIGFVEKINDENGDSTFKIHYLDGEEVELGSYYLDTVNKRANAEDPMGIVSERYAVVSDYNTAESQYGVVDLKTGELVIGLNYNLLYQTKDDNFVAKMGDKTGLIDIKTKKLLPYDYDFIAPVDDFYVVAKDHKMAIVDNEYNFVTDFEFDMEEAKQYYYKETDANTNDIVAYKAVNKYLLVVNSRPSTSVTYDEGTAYDRTDRDLEENPSGNDGNDPGVHGTDSSDWDTYTPDTGTDEGENPTGEEQTDTDPGEDTNPDEGENPTGEEQTDTNPGEDATPGDGETSTGSEQTDNKPEEDTSSEDGEKNTGSEQTDKNIDEDKEQGGGDGVDGQDNSGARLVETSGNLVDQLVGEDGLNALEIDDVAAWGAAGMAGLMLGMTNLGTDENGEGFLSNLATGLDDDRTLADSGIDVFEHPDYTDQNDTALLSNGGWSSYDDAVAAGFGDSIMSEAEFLEAKAAGDPSVSQYSSYQEYLDAMYNSYLGGVDGLNSDGNIGAFNLQSANELDGTGNGTSVVGGFAALGGAAAVGGLAAGAVIGADEANGGLISSDMTMNSDGTLSDGKQSINDFLFGALDDPDEEEKKKQTLRERIAMIAAAATGTSSLATFGLANAGVIGPTWFTVSVLLLAVALLYFEMVVDKKNKRREELESVKQMTARRGFFNQNNVQETTTNKQVDWILFGMVLLSTSAFILKTYDVISWLLFLILLILFILIIVAYVILKKKLGENNNGVPY